MIPETLVPWLAVAALVISLLALLLAARAAFRRPRSAVLAPPSGAVRDRDLLVDLERIDRLAAELDALAQRVEGAEALGRRSMQHVGIVRYNPFADTGSNQSFVLAVLDAQSDGFVLSGLHSRQQTRVFLKSISAGRAEAGLSDEETEAIRRARNSHGGA